MAETLRIERPPASWNIAAAGGLHQAIGNVSEVFHTLDSRVRALGALWRKGLPSAAIAQRLGVSKSAVAAKARRLDLPMRVPQNARPGSRAPG